MPELLFRDFPALATSPWMRHHGIIDDAYFGEVHARYPDLLDRHPELGRSNPAFLAYVARAEASAAPPPAPPMPEMELMRSLFAYDLPQGWEALPGDSVRLFNLRPAGDPDAECSFAMLPSDGGGVTPNVNRWRDQMGLGPITEQEAMALPTRTWFKTGGAAVLEAVVVDLQGVYTAMGGSPRSDQRMLGLISMTPFGALFVKMTGPASVVEDERERFFAFCDSVRISDEASALQAAQGAGPEIGPSAGAAGGAAIDRDSLTWTVPAGWTDQGPRTMRHVSYQAAPSTDAYLAFASGDRLDNYNRWCDQVGAQRITAADLAALPTVTILGQECPLLEVAGTYRGMGNVNIPDATLVGARCNLQGEALFVKMIGPTAEVAATMATFLAFCDSIGSK
ncbi:MAG: hypothetical protein O2816_06410 [Planctomycetota bacterium]|nr:hypothetical protein [Planctomycetota bacterium]